MNPIDVLIITAAEGEDEELRHVDDAAIGPWEETDGPHGFSGEVWHRSYVAHDGRALRVALVKATAMGGEAAAIAAGALVSAFRPTVLAMCGVCAGRPGRVNLGDVIIADRVYRYDSGETVQEVVRGRVVERIRPDITTFQITARWKRGAERVQVPEDAGWLTLRPRPIEHQSYWLLSELAAGRDPGAPERSAERNAQCADWSVVVDDLWKRRQLKPGRLELSEAGKRHLDKIKARHPDGFPQPVPFRIHVGPIATGNTVVKVAGFFNRLTRQQRSVLGVEMEASAIGHAAHALAVSHMIVVKGVMDDASPAKSDRVKAFAARAAAEVLIGFLRQHLEPRAPSAAEILSPNTLGPTIHHNPATLLNARYGQVPFDEELRTDELRDLELWCADPRPVLGRLFVGPGGAGKTRLFIEWCARLRDRGWLAGFLRDHPSEEVAGLLLRSSASTLAVIDYAESRPELLAFVRTLARGMPPTRVRVALLARAPSDWWRSLLGLDDDVRHLLSDREPRTLRAVAASEPFRYQIFSRARDAFVTALGRDETPDRAHQLNDPRFERVLYLHLAALATVEGLESAAPTLLEEILGHEKRFLVRRFTQEFAGGDIQRAEFLSAAERVLAALTLRGGAGSRDEAEALANRVRGPNVPHFVRFLKSIYPGRDDGSATGRYLAGLEPDLLGEHLVDRVLSDSETPANYLDLVFEDADSQAMRMGFMILARSSLRQGQGAHSIERMLHIDVNGRARAAFDAAMALGDESALSPIGDVLAGVLRQRGTLRLARELEPLVPAQTVMLCGVGAWASERLLEELEAGDHPERARLFDSLGGRLSELGQRETAAEVTRKAVEHYRALVAERPNIFRSGLAKSLNNLGNQLSDIGQREEALQVTHEAVEEYRALAEASPDTFRPNLATSLSNLGNRLSDLGRREEALESTREALEIHQALAEIRPEAFRPDLAISLSNLGNRLSQLGRQEEALEATRAALEIRRALAEMRPDAFRSDLAASLNNVGTILSELGHREEALEAMREAVGIRRALAEVRPEAFRPDLAASLSNLGGRLSDLGMPEQALEATREALEIRRALAEVQPEAFRPNLADTLVNFGTQLGELGRREEALEATREAAEHYRALAEARPGAFRPYLASSLNNVSNRLSELGRREEALQAARETVEIRRALVQVSAEAFRPDLAMSLNNLGNRLSELGQREEALETTREAVEHYRTLAVLRPEAFRPDLATSLNNLGVLLSELGQRQEALEAIREATDIRRVLAEIRPAAFQPDLAASLDSLGTRLGELGRREEALEATRESVELRRALTAMRPEVFQSDLAASLTNLGVRLNALGHPEEALQVSREAVQHYRKLAEARPEVFRPSLAVGLNNLSAVFSALRRRTEAVEAIRESVKIRRALAETRPDVFRPGLAMSLSNLGIMLGEVGERDEAFEAAREAVEIRRALVDMRPDAFRPDLAASLNNVGARLSDLGRREEAVEAVTEAVDLYCSLAERLPDAFVPRLREALTSLIGQLGEEELRTHPTAIRAAAVLRESGDH